MTEQTSGVISLDSLVELLEQQLNEEKGSLNKETELTALGGWDSMGVLLVMAELDEQIGITLNETEMDDIKTVGDFAALLESKGLLKAG